MTLLALPMLGFIWLSVSSILQSANIKSEMSAIASLTQLSVIYSELVHEVQKERGMTAGYIGSKGTKFADKLKGQRKNTDAKRQKQMKFWQEHDFQLNEIVHQCSTISLTLGSNLAAKLLISASIDFPVIIAFCKE